MGLLRILRTFRQCDQFSRSVEDLLTPATPAPAPSAGNFFRR